MNNKEASRWSKKNHGVAQVRRNNEKLNKKPQSRYREGDIPHLERVGRMDGDSLESP